MRNIALITGILGQDGAYLAEFLLKKNYKVIGISRNLSSFKKWRLKKLNIESKVILERKDICKISDIKFILKKYKISEIYNFAAQSYVNKSFVLPLETVNVNTSGVIKLLESIRIINPKIKFYQASSSEMFGNINSSSYKKEFNFKPESPYAISKLFSHHITRNYRNSYNLYAISGILFNHESPLRDNTFVIKKIIVGLVKIFKKNTKVIELGNIYARRDWGYAKDYIPQIWKMMQLREPEDFILATGKTHSIKELINIATKYLKLNVKWIGKGLNEKLIDKSSKKIIIRINKKLFRPSELNYSKGDLKKFQKT